MKINMIKNAGGTLAPADEEAAEQMLKISNGSFNIIDVKLNQNYQLHKKIFAFFKFCAQYYYGDIDVTKDQVDLTRRKITMSAGYVKQIFLPDGVRFELTPLSIKYEKLTPEDRQDFYNKIINAALKNVFGNCGPDVENQLMSFL
jgi:hypothetical protein